MQSPNQYHEMESLATFASAATRSLTVAEERDLLDSLADSKAKLAATLASIKGADEIPSEPEAFTRFVADFYARADQDAFGRHLGVIFAIYLELRGKLAMANLKLVAHVAKRYRDRGVLYSDLLQEGFCGLLEAIDRFDPAHETKLATYAVWWIRQAMQLAVAAGAYPVRLQPRHLLELAQYHHAVDQGLTNKAQSETIKRIQAATRPSVALNGAVDGAFFLGWQSRLDQDRFKRLEVGPRGLAEAAAPGPAHRAPLQRRAK